jgi:hypothetical protein
MKGYSSTAGPELPQASYKVDSVVTYVDKWMWDITLYLIELTVTLREPNQWPAFSDRQLLPYIADQKIAGRNGG